TFRQIVVLFLIVPCNSVAVAVADGRIALVPARLRCRKVLNYFKKYIQIVRLILLIGINKLLTSEIQTLVIKMLD
ncbi:MAG: hypothetical protein AAF349_14370, partial [Cyanobacteria bacterium P01_A01_bin.68]